ncbi:MAG: hypothetical protein EBR30_15185 [Cytophagia bacterium]|nr:hypothetical protein [Cytophagia bacterium]
MKKKYKYRPPIFYLFLGLGGLYTSYIFFRGFGVGEIGISIIIGFFGLACLGLGLGFTILFINKISTGDLLLTDDYLEIPGRWKKRQKVRLSDIRKVNEIDTYDSVLEISSNRGLHLIERKWMSRKDFQELRDILKEKLK